VLDVLDGNKKMDELEASNTVALLKAPVETPKK